MAIGDYYIVCKRCGKRELSQDAGYDPRYGWKCNEHRQYNPHHEQAPRLPVDSKVPKIIRAPRQDSFGLSDGIYWNTWETNWEDNTFTDWEDL